MIKRTLDIIGHTQKLLNVNQFLRSVFSPDSGGTIRTDTGDAVTSGGWAIGSAQKIPTTTYNTQEGEFPHPDQIMGHMAHYQSKGVKYLGGWHPIPETADEGKENLQIDAVSLHSDKTIDRVMKSRPQEKTVFNLDTFEEKDNPHYKGK
jgi:hypothetical protein